MSESNYSPVEPPIPMERIQEFSGGDRDFERELLHAFVDDVQNRIHNLQEAISNQDSAAIRHESHQIKGASANIGATAMQDVSSQLEEGAKKSTIEGASELLQELEILLDRVRIFVETL